MFLIFKNFNWDKKGNCIWDLTFLLESHHELAASCGQSVQRNRCVQDRSEHASAARCAVEWRLQLLIVPLSVRPPPPTCPCVLAAANMSGILRHHSPEPRCQATLVTRKKSPAVCGCLFPLLLLLSVIITHSHIRDLFQIIKKEVWSVFVKDVVHFL